MSNDHNPPLAGATGSTLTVSWFSAGVSSAVATWLEIGTVDRIVYQHINDHHIDTLRFISDCESWWGKPVERIQHALKSVESACLHRQFINGIGGASCTRMLKRELREKWERENQFFNRFRYVWGMDAKEVGRADDIREAMPEADHVFPLIERGISKPEAHAMLAQQGVSRPALYDLGYPNNNCVGCVKGGMGYWNKIRIDFPEVFAARAALERRIGASCINGVYLDELPPNAGRKSGTIVPACGVVCGSMPNSGMSDSAAGTAEDAR